MTVTSARGVVAAGATAVTVAVVGAVLWTTSGGEEATEGVPRASGSADDEASTTARPVEQTAAPTVVAGLAPTVAPGEVADDEPADALAEPVVDIRSDALSSPDGTDQDKLFSVAKGLALDALGSTVAEYRERGWSQVGRPTVVSTQVTASDPDSDPPHAMLDVCLDYTGVDVVDTEGTSVVDSAAQTRVLNIFEMEYQDGRWVLVDQSFADDTTC